MLGFNQYSISSSPHPPLMTRFPCCQFPHPWLAACSAAASISGPEAAHNWWCACCPCALELLFVWRGCRGRLNLCRLSSMKSWGLEGQKENNLIHCHDELILRNIPIYLDFASFLGTEMFATGCRDSLPYACCRISIFALELISMLHNQYRVMQGAD